MCFHLPVGVTNHITGFTVMSVQLSRFILHLRAMKTNFRCGAKPQLGFRDTVSPNQVQGSMLKGIRGQSSQDFKKFGDLKTMKFPFVLVSYGTCLTYLSIIKWILFLFPQKCDKFEYYFQFV